MKIWWAAAVCILLSQLGTVVAQQAITIKPKTLARNAAEFVELQEDLNFLASDLLEGRDTGSNGIQMAAEYLLTEFAAAGWRKPDLLPAGLQDFPLPSPAKLGSDNRLQMTVSNQEIKLNYGAEFIPCSLGGAGTVQAPLVFCGYGLKHEQYNDFANVDVKGKVIIVLRRVPGQNQPGTLFINNQGKLDINQAALRTKIKNAIDHGAAAVMIVNDSHTAATKDELMSFGYGGFATGDSIPVLQITRLATDLLLRPTLGKTIAELEQLIDREIQPKSLEITNARILLNVDLRQEKILGKNVIVTLEPADTETAAETIVIGAHYDHVGWGTYGSLAPQTNAIHNGADDNASGTVALLGLARRLQSMSGMLPRRVVLIAFAAEERGLLGSKYYVEQPIYPLEQTIAMLNLDMVGRLADEKLTVFGTSSATEWEGWLDPIEAHTKLIFFREPKAFGPSDHASFYEKKIPVLHLFTGLHEDYHRPTDDISDLNIQGIQRVVDVLEQLTLKLATAEHPPQYRENKKWIQVGNHAGGRGYLGLIPELSTTPNGLVIQRVMQNSPAARAGIRQGDRITVVNGIPVSERNDFWNVIDQLKPGDEIPVEITRGSQKFPLVMKLAVPR